MEGSDCALEALRRAEAELERQIDAVRRIAVSLSAATELRELVQEALSTTLRLCHSEAGSILLYDADKQKLVFAHVIGEKAAELAGLAIGADQGIAGAVFQTGKALVTEDAAAEGAHLRDLGEKVGYVTGTGLGTRIIKDVVDAHGGTLKLNSELGVGTTICCRLPLGR